MCANGKYNTKQPQWLKSATLIPTRASHVPLPGALTCVCVCVCVLVGSFWLLCDEWKVVEAARRIQKDRVSKKGGGVRGVSGGELLLALATHQK